MDFNLLVFVPIGIGPRSQPTRDLTFQALGPDPHNRRLEQQLRRDGREKETPNEQVCLPQSGAHCECIRKSLSSQAGAAFAMRS